jgi:hypothetical protein
MGREVDLQDHLEAIVDLAERYSLPLQKLREDGCEIDIRCSYSSDSGQGGFALPNELLARIAKLSFGVMVDLFPPVDGSDF